MNDGARKSSAQHAAMNAAAWDEIAVERRTWLDSIGFDARFFAAGGSTLSATELEALGDLHGKRVLHLQCASGEDTLSLANQGAIVTGIDVSARGIEEARAKAAAAGIQATFDVADVQALPDRYRHGDFDAVYTGLGAILWLDNLDGWGSGIGAALRHGGTFVLYEAHPIEYIYEEIGGRLVVVHSYFDTEPEYETGWGHFPTEEGRATKAEFSWTVGGVVSALGRHGVATVELRELPDWDCSPDGSSRYRFERFPGLIASDRGKVPAAILLRAVKV